MKNILRVCGPQQLPKHKYISTTIFFPFVVLLFNIAWVGRRRYWWMGHVHHHLQPHYTTRLFFACFALHHLTFAANNDHLSYKNRHARPSLRLSLKKVSKNLYNYQHILSKTCLASLCSFSLTYYTSITRIYFTLNCLKVVVTHSTGRVNCFRYIAYLPMT